MRSLLREMFRYQATEICEAADGNEAESQCLLHQPDLVLMDIRMPGTDGIAATQRLLHINPRMRVVIVTEYDDDEYREEARKAGASAYFLKENLMALRQNLRIILGSIYGGSAY
jgi:DNA-binding NarL/FixJ family response regulator